MEQIAVPYGVVDGRQSSPFSRDLVSPVPLFVVICYVLCLYQCQTLVSDSDC